jgi:hypothetical protein
MRPRVETSTHAAVSRSCRVVRVHATSLPIGHPVDAPLVRPLVTHDLRAIRRALPSKHMQLKGVGRSSRRGDDAPPSIFGGLRRLLLLLLRKQALAAVALCVVGTDTCAESRRRES